MKWRTGRKLGRTIYSQLGPEPSDDDILLGLMDDRAAATLAAAAPDLLAALEANARETHSEHHHPAWSFGRCQADSCSRARAAIAKAKGEQP